MEKPIAMTCFNSGDEKIQMIKGKAFRDRSKISKGYSAAR